MSCPISAEYLSITAGSLTDNREVDLLNALSTMMRMLAQVSISDLTCSIALHAGSVEILYKSSLSGKE